MRLLFAALALCLSATGALAYSAVAYAHMQDGRMAYGYKTNAATVKEAQDEALAACESAVKTSTAAVARGCHLFDVITHGCFSLYQTPQALVITGGHGFSEAEAQRNSKAICENNATSGHCYELVTFCEPGPLTLTTRVLGAPGELASEAFSQWVITPMAWWNSISKFDIVVSAALIFLVAAFGISLMKILQLQRALIKGGGSATAPAPEPSPPPAAKPDLVAQLGEALAQEPVLPPMAEPTGLDTTAIKQALRTKRQEFDL